MADGIHYWAGVCPVCTTKLHAKLSEAQQTMRIELAPKPFVARLQEGDIVVVRSYGEGVALAKVRVDGFIRRYVNTRDNAPVNYSDLDVIGKVQLVTE
jgi:hypothetical protein